MKYLLVLLIGVAAGAYVMDVYDKGQITLLQQQVQDLNASVKAAKAELAAAQAAQVPPAPTGDSDSSAIDAARRAATAPGTNIGTVTTTDGQIYTNCRIVKQDDNGVTFNNDQGIIEVPFWKMSPDLQKEFGYSIEKTAEQAAAQARYNDQQAAALQNSSATTH